MNSILATIESQKGRFISIFWAIFNLGGVVGASVSLGQNFHRTVSWNLRFLAAKRTETDKFFRRVVVS